MNTHRPELTYLPGLNAIRAFAALIVLIFHFDLFFAKHFGITAMTIFPTNYQASTAVTLFFVLSGFLITYLMLLEKAKSNTIRIKFFYIRRITRIWPLYFLIIFFTILLNYVAGNNLIRDEPGILFLYCSFLGNVIEPFGITVHNAHSIIFPMMVLWSLGVEEQFYLVWPILNKTFNKTVTVLFTFIIAWQILKILFKYTGHIDYATFLSYTRIDCMAIGALGAYVFKNRAGNTKRIFRFLTSKAIGVCCIMAFFAIFYFKLHVASLFDQQLVSVVFTVFILNTAGYSRFFRGLENKICNFLGQISYGIYMYHVLIIIAVTTFVKHVQLPNSYVSYFVFLFAIMLSTILISYLSYRFLERPFLKIKSNFAVVKTTN